MDEGLEEGMAAVKGSVRVLVQQSEGSVTIYNLKHREEKKGRPKIEGGPQPFILFSFPLPRHDHSSRKMPFSERLQTLRLTLV